MWMVAPPLGLEILGIMQACAQGGKSLKTYPQLGKVAACRACLVRHVGTSAESYAANRRAWNWACGLPAASAGTGSTLTAMAGNLIARYRLTTTLPGSYLRLSNRSGPAANIAARWHNSTIGRDASAMRSPNAALNSANSVTGALRVKLAPRKVDRSAAEATSPPEVRSSARPRQAPGYRPTRPGHCATASGDRNRARGCGRGSRRTRGHAGRRHATWFPSPPTGKSRRCRR